MLVNRLKVHETTRAKEVAIIFIDIFNLLGTFSIPEADDKRITKQECVQSKKLLVWIENY